MTEDSQGLRDGLEASSGDPRLVLLLNALLSTWFAWTVVWGLDFLGVVAYTLTNVAVLASVLFVVTYVVVLQ